MYTIKDAKIRRFTEIDGIRCAEIEMNYLHSAFEEVMNVVFRDANGKDLHEKRGRFTRELLSHGKMDSELAAEFAK